MCVFATLCSAPLAHAASFALQQDADQAGVDPAAPVSDALQPDALRQVAGILAYIGSDYAGAVDDAGQVINELEYREQFTLLEDALALATEVGLGTGDSLVAGLQNLLPMLEQRAPPQDVLALCRDLQRDLASQHAVVLIPRQRPDHERGRALYVENKCSVCHGERGDADTRYVDLLDPPPANFLDPERVAGVTPFRAFHAITVGVAGTAMAEHAHLSERDAWDLAFHVLSLRHDATAAEAGRDLLAASDWAGPITCGALAAATEDDLRSELKATFEDEADRDNALAWLRVGAPYVLHEPRDFPVARQLLEQGLAAARQGQANEARRLFVSAYLDGFEPFEPGLRARDSGLVVAIEEAMLGLRQDLSEISATPASSGSEATRSAAAVEHLVVRVAHLQELLDRAGQSTGGRWTSFTGSLLIALREGLEMVLLIGALLALVRRRGAPRLARSVHAGWLAALPAGLATWLLLGEALGGLQRELAEGLIALTAAAVLLCVTHWFLGQATARQMMGFVSQRMENALTRRGAAGTVFALAFVAVYRELVEVALFYKAMLLPADAPVAMILMGLVTGLVLLGIVAAVLKRAGQRLPMRSFMLATSLMLALLALVLVGKGIRALQEADWVGSTRVFDFQIDALGLFGSSQGLTAQGVVLALLALSALLSWRTARKNAPPSNGSADPTANSEANPAANRASGGPSLSPTTPPR